MNESVIISNVFHHVAWGTTISVYFWLVGASAGAYVIASLGWVFGVERYKQLALPATGMAIILLMLVPVLLVWDLGQPLRFIYLMLPSYWHATGPMSWGSVLIMIYPITMMFYGYSVIKENKRWAKMIGGLCVFLAVAVELYTGVVMEFNPGRSLNHTALAPLLFLTGAFISGVAVLVLWVWIRNMIVSAISRAEKRVDWSLMEELAQYMMYGLIFDAFLLFLEFMQSVYGNQDEVMAHEEVLLGVFRFSYLWLEIVIGLLIPIIILVSPLKRTRFGIVIACIMVGAGVYGMRIWWVMGGQYLQTFY